jgi:hypothetical protein
MFVTEENFYISELLDRIDKAAIFVCGGLTPIAY